MIDPMGPDPSDPRTPPRQVGEILPEPPVPASPSKSASPRKGAEPEPSAAHESPAPTALARPRSTGFQRAIGVAKTVLPLVGKILPLLEGNVVATASNLLTPNQ